MTTETHFMLCIENKGYPSSLEFGKVYRVIPDEKADKHKMLRVIDESGEDYLYPQNYFVSIQLPPIAQDAFMSAR
jgi:hypothetical protein